MPYIYEVHLHTDESSVCGRTPAREYIPYYMDRGYDGIVVTDHFTGNPSYVPDRTAPWKQQVDDYCRGYEEALDEGIRRGFKVFFGIEQQFANDECLIYGADKQWLLDHPDAPQWSRRRWFDEINAIHGCIVLAHPFRVRNYVKRITLNTCVHAIEAYNSANKPEDDVYGLAYGKRFGYPLTAGTDMHCIHENRELYGVVFDEPWKDISSYVQAIREHKPFGCKMAEGRGLGVPTPLERSYELLDASERCMTWDVSDIF